MKLLDRAGLLFGSDVTLGEIFDRLARIHGDRLLFEQVDPPVRSTFREAAERTARLAGGVAGRVARGDRVVVATDNSYDMFLLCVAASRAGALPVPVNPQMAPAEIDHVIADSGAVLVIRDAAEVEGPPLGSAVPADAGDVAAIFYSSGTTGKPKGARLTHRALLSQAKAGALYPAGLRREEAVVALPIAHIMGFVVVLGLASAGVPLFFVPRFRPAVVLDAIESRRSTMFIGVPAMYRMLLEAGAEQRDLRSVRVWGSGADVMPGDLARRFQRMGATATLPVIGASFGEAVFVEGYGMVETGGGVAAKVLPPGVVPGPLRDVLGVPLPPYRFRVVDEDGQEVKRGAIGELLVKGPGVLEGYHGDLQATRAVLTEDGWLHTGDLARRGPFGLITFAGRGKDVIKVGGYSVYAVEVQEALEAHESVAEAAVVGLPDDRMGERVVAAVRLLPGAAVADGELVDWCVRKLASYKVPADVRVVDDLPRTATEKVRKEDVKSLFTGG